MDSLFADAEKSFPDSEVKSSCRPSLKTDENFFPLGLKNEHVSSWGSWTYLLLGICTTLKSMISFSVKCGILLYGMGVSP